MSRGLAVQVFAAILMCVVAAGYVRAESMMGLAGDRAERGVVVTVGDQVGQVSDLDQSLMLRRLIGRIAVLDVRELAAVGKCETKLGLPPERVMEARGMLDIVIEGRISSKRLRLMEGSDGLVYVQEINETGDLDKPEREGKTFKVDREKLRETAIEQGWEWPIGPRDLEGEVKERRGEVFEVVPPRAPGRYTVDKVLISKRIVGEATDLRRSERVLNQEKFWCRLPRGYTHKRPAGVVVWVDASESGRPPGEFDKTLDELNLICIGAGGAGNNRLVTDRFQLAFDAVATVRERFHVDIERVYLAGISGGGRVVSILQGCFPEVFKGTVAIVGLSVFEAVSGPDGKTYLPNYARPSERIFEQLQQQRIAVISGQLDFNFLQIQTAVTIMQGRGLDIRLFEYADMGHQMPTAERFGQSMKWVDEERSERMAADTKRADEAMKKWNEKWKDAGVTAAAARRELIDITRDWPWTDAAWEAAKMLGVCGTHRADRE